MELDLAVDVFERGARSSLRARQGLVRTHASIVAMFVDSHSVVAHPAEAS